MTNRIIRWLVQFRGQPDVGYHTSLGKEVKNWAFHTARSYGGRLLCEFDDGSTTVRGDWTRNSPEGAAEPAADPV